MAFGREAVRGMAQLRTAFKALPDVAREALGDATEETGEQIRAAAVRSVPVRYGFLRNHIAVRMSRKTGVARVGIEGGAEQGPDGKTVYPSKYAHYAEFGTSKAPAQPFMLPAAEGEKGPYLERCRKAGKAIEREMSRIGGRFE